MSIEKRIGLDKGCKIEYGFHYPTRNTTTILLPKPITYYYSTRAARLPKEQVFVEPLINMLQTSDARLRAATARALESVSDSISNPGQGAHIFSLN